VSAPGSWIGVDLDGTLAYYDGWKGADHIGEPVPAMVERVTKWLERGQEVRIFTARVYTDGTPQRNAEAEYAMEVVARWCFEHIGMVLPITCVKDYAMLELWDDRVVRVPANSGQRCCTSGESRRALIERIARVCHEANRAYCESLGDDSQLSWEDAPEWQRESARMGVDFHLSGDFPPSASHVSWYANKEAEGWVYGPVKDAEKKEHPCMVPYEELPREQQAKDHIFRAIVHAMQKD
jgi:hypothetical protein